MTEELVGILLMSFGTALSDSEVPQFLSRVRGGPVPDAVVEEMKRRYQLIGGSPLIRITRSQAKALETLLNRRNKNRYRVEVGMRYSRPFIKQAYKKLAELKPKRIIAIILSPQYSKVLMEGYHQDIEDAQSELSNPIATTIAPPWHDLPSYINAVAQRTREAMDRLIETDRSNIPILMTAHSMPKVVVDKDPDYIEMLIETAESIAQALSIPDKRWQLAYQSAGHAPVEWLKPDIADLFPQLSQAGHRKVLIVPIQFLADHLEILYDIDIAAQLQAEEAGLELTRVEAFNTMPLFISTLADVIIRELPT